MSELRGLNLKKINVRKGLFPKRKKQCLPSKKRKQEEIKDVIGKTILAEDTAKDSLKQVKRESKKEQNEGVDRQQGESNLCFYG